MHPHETHGHPDHPHGNGLPTTSGRLYLELVLHLPFSVSSVAIGLIIAGIICFLAPVEVGSPPGHDLTRHALTEGPVPPQPTEERASQGDEQASPAHDAHDHGAYVNPFQPMFHLYHPVHMLFSAAATTAMFWRYERRLLKAVVVGMVGSIGVCGVSDIVIPQLTLILLGRSVPWHVCLIEHPSMVLSFAVVGVALGLAAPTSVRQSTFFSHSLHVLVSTMASIFYLIGPFGRLGWIEMLGTVFPFIIVAVLVPCCFSDIGFPLLLVRRARAEYHDEHISCGHA